MDKLRFKLSICACIFVYSLFGNYSYIKAQEQVQNSLVNENEEIRGEFGNWLQICVKDTPQCVAVQFALDIQGNRAGRFVLERLPSNTESAADSVITFFIPFEASIPILPNGLSFTIDSNAPFTEQFLFCDQLGCTSQFGMTAEGMGMIREGANITIQIIDIRDPDSRYIMDLDLDQFMDIYEKLGKADLN